MVSFFHLPVALTFHVKLQIDNNYYHLHQHFSNTYFSWLLVSFYIWSDTRAKRGYTVVMNNLRPKLMGPCIVLFTTTRCVLSTGFVSGHIASPVETCVHPSPRKINLLPSRIGVWCCRGKEADIPTLEREEQKDKDFGASLGSVSLRNPSKS